MLRNLTDEERAEILSEPRPGESVEDWLRREDEQMLLRYTDRKTTRPRPVNGHQPDDGDDPKKRMESWLSLPTPMKMRLAIACDILEMFPPSRAEIEAFRAANPWPENWKITIEIDGKKIE
jgi:hypothetical protein